MCSMNGEQHLAVLNFIVRGTHKISHGQWQAGKGDGDRVPWSFRMHVPSNLIGKSRQRSNEGCLDKEHRSNTCLKMYGLTPRPKSSGNTRACAALWSAGRPAIGTNMGGHSLFWEPVQHGILWRGSCWKIGLSMVAGMFNNHTDLTTRVMTAAMPVTRWFDPGHSTIEVFEERMFLTTACVAGNAKAISMHSCPCIESIHEGRPAAFMLVVFLVHHFRTMASRPPPNDSILLGSKSWNQLLLSYSSSTNEWTTVVWP